MLRSRTTKSNFYETWRNRMKTNVLKSIQRDSQHTEIQYGMTPTHTMRMHHWIEEIEAHNEDLSQMTVGIRFLTKILGDGDGLLNVTMDTILICFCEDCEINDGMARPYAMSKELMEFVDNYKKMLGIPQESMPVEVEYPQAV
ncbi:hypothetical protein NQ318_010391 [Aromia moschata]|uniref:Uncharacterized protein n=1 Tax=Aromia moschata TaxID=1265417 RepID=A0AAV8Y3Y2_9CUCU|nr:hypothetical protein NQ318_010391 [Aromia moschata]